MFAKSKFLIVLLASLPLIAMAEEVEYKVKGMTCSACIKSIRKSLCDSNKFEVCKVEFSRVVLKAKENQTIDKQQVENLLKEAGDYSIVSNGKTDK